MLEVVILVIVLLGGCKTQSSVTIFYDAGFRSLSSNQQEMVKIVIRDLQLKHNLFTLITTSIKPRQKPNMTRTRPFMILTTKPTPDKLHSSSIRFEPGFLVWSLNIKRSCSESFRLLKPPSPGIEVLSNLIVSAHGTTKSLLSANTVICSKSQWQNQAVIVGTTEARPFVVRSEVDGVLKWSGKDIDLFTDLAKRIGFKYAIIEPAERTYGVVLNGTANGLKGLSSRNEIDVAVYANLYDLQLNLAVVWPTYYGRWAVVIPPPMILYDLLSNTRPFNFEVWLCVIASILCVGLAMWFVARISGHATDLGLDVLYNIALITGQGGFSPKYLPGRFLAATWNLGAFVVVFSYTSILISFVTAPTPEPLINTLQDFVTKRTLKPVAYKGQIFSDYFVEAESGLAKEIGDLFRSNPQSLAKTDGEAVQLVLGGRYAFITGIPMAESAISADFRVTRKCRMTMAQEKGVGLDLVGWHASRLVPALSQILHKWVLCATEAGLLVYYETLYVPRVNCFYMRNLVGSSNDSPLTLVQVQTAFLILGLGVLASLLAFIGEKFIPILLQKGNM